MYKRQIDQETYEKRLKAHEEQNKSNAKRRKNGKPPIDSFPKQELKIPQDLSKMRNLKTFIISDEFDKVKDMPVRELLQYLFRNMLIYECNLLFDRNFELKYNYDTVRISKTDYRRIFYSTVDKIPQDCHQKDNYLYFRFDLKNIRSLNKRYSSNGKARQYILFNYSFIYVALRLTLSPKSKAFLLLILSLYKHSDQPKIQHSLPKLLQACNISLKQSKQTAIDRINKYFNFLEEWGILGDNYLNYKFTVDDLNCGRSLNIRLNPLNVYFS